MRECGSSFTLDCSVVHRVVGFWTAAADLVVEGVIEGGYVDLTGLEFTLTLRRVPEPKTAKNRMHLDLLVEDLEKAVARLESLGATRLSVSARRGLVSVGMCSRILKATSSASRLTIQPTRTQAK
jgi:Glyoxalase-like domain